MFLKLGARENMNVLVYTLGLSFPIGPKYAELIYTIFNTYYSARFALPKLRIAGSNKW